MSDWVRPRPSTLGRDPFVAAALTVGFVVTALLFSRLDYFGEPAPVWLSAIIIAVQTVPLAWRRRYPLVVAIVVSLGFFANSQFSVPELLFTNITLFLGIYSLGAWGRNRRAATVARIVIIVGMFIWVAVNLVRGSSDPDFSPDISRAGVFSQFASLAVIQIITNALNFGAAFYFGSGAWRSAAERALLEARTGELTDARSLTAAQAVALDRVRIARELHDVVAHHVSVMGVQAGAARRVLSTDPDSARTSLEAIEQSARAAVDELHRLLTTLRSDDTETAAGLADSATQGNSTRGIDQLGELVAETTAAGMPATLRVVGEPRPVTAMAGFAVYRVAQEALTNARKHAGVAATVDVRLRYLDGAIEIEIADTGAGRGLTGSTGLGLLGMRERVSAAGGTLEAHPRSRGGYLVRAALPA